MMKAGISGGCIYMVVSDLMEHEVRVLASSERCGSTPFHGIAA